jgi:signal transduction histidine kinase
MTGIILLISYFAVILIILLGYHTMIRPFNRLSEYPEKIAKGRIETGIPESKQRLFGKYVWGMNMLKDEMKHKENSLNIMEKEKQTLIISIAHGIKTPLSNIKLYAEAIERGIYHEDKKPNEKDAETAAKISRNVEKVEALVKDIMDKSAEYNVDYTPKIESFYLEELMKMVKKEYSGRAELLHIPFETVCENNPLVTSDKDGIYTIISQLMENAIKYGSGQGISVIMGRQDEDVFITVKNKGNVLSEEETAYVFKSFWRGSNSHSTEGQGIGLYVSRKIAEALSGDIFMKAWEAEDTTEVTLIIPTNIG